MTLKCQSAISSSSSSSSCSSLENDSNSSNSDEEITKDEFNAEQTAEGTQLFSRLAEQLRKRNVGKEQILVAKFNQSRLLLFYRYRRQQRKKMNILGIDQGLAMSSRGTSVPPRRRDSSPIGNAFSAIFGGTGVAGRRSFNFTEKIAKRTNRSLSQSQEFLSTVSQPKQIVHQGKEAMQLEGLAYLGCSKMDDPTSEVEMHSIMRTLNSENGHDAVPVALIVPNSATGIVRLLESSVFTPSTSCTAEICSFPINRIRFCARGKPNSKEKNCFALCFTQFTGSSQSTASVLHQCHVFRCATSEQAAQAVFCFAQTFRQLNTEPAKAEPLQQQRNQQMPVTGTTVQLSPSNDPCGPDEEIFEFETFLEIKEKETSRRDNHRSEQQNPNGEGNYVVCPLERNCFKMRRDRHKRVIFWLKQAAGRRHLRVKKCFGLLLAAGRNLRESDMHLLEMQSSGEGQHNPLVFIVEARWNPSAQNFEVLNTETPRETRVFLTVAIDIIFEGLDESIRFNLECKARIFQQYERFWSPQRRAMSEKYKLLVQKKLMTADGQMASTSTAVTMSEVPHPKETFKVLRFESATERERSSICGATAAGTEKSPCRQMPTQLIHPADEDESDSDEPLLSGSGAVSRECSEDRLAAWKEIVEEWEREPDKRPLALNSLIHDGIPDVMRGQVWLLLARVGGPDAADLVQTYQILLEKECPSDPVILRDIHRTFPAHEYFKETNEQGQKSLYKISKAYSLYDEEVGYCQGLSFLAAALLLHMPEEQAFCVLVRIMFDYGMRELFKMGFDALHLRFYQLQGLIKDYAHELFAHFYSVGIETHMYASQWFLTLFTAKFPLQMVFFIVDLFLAEGINTIFHISLALLQDSKMELLQSDFEGVLKFFRVNLPRKYRTETNAKELIHAAVKLKISHKRLAKYEKEWHELKRQEIESQDPLERLERENCRLKEQILRLERENDDLAHELVTSKINLQSRLDVTEDHLEAIQNQLVRKGREYEELVEGEKQIRMDSVKWQQDVNGLREELRRMENVICEYKRICTEQGLSAEQDKRHFDKQKRIVAARITNCDQCMEALSDWIAPVMGGGGGSSNHSSPTGSRPRSRASNNGEGREQPKLNGFSALHMIELVERLQQREDHIRLIELELAQTKLALVESQCQNQDLSHQLSSNSGGLMLMQNSTLCNGEQPFHSNGDHRPAWLKKTISSLREVAAQAQGTSTKSSYGGHHQRSSSNASMASMDCSNSSNINNGLLNKKY